VREAPRGAGGGSATLSANVAWESGQSGAFDPGTFASEIGPKLEPASLAEMTRATGLSRPYCAMTRGGARMPHPRHWVTPHSLAKYTIFLLTERARCYAPQREIAAPPHGNFTPWQKVLL
jgi:hypothetical protein